MFINVTRTHRIGLLTVLSIFFSSNFSEFEQYQCIFTVSFQTEVQSIGQWYMITLLLLFGRARPIARDAESVKRSPLSHTCVWFIRSLQLI